MSDAAPSPPAAAPPVALYAYFRSRAEDAVVAAALADAGRRLVAAGWPAPTLWRRPERRDGRATWMEVHAPQPAGRVDALLAAADAAARDSGLQALLDGERQVERFVPIQAP